MRTIRHKSDPTFFGEIKSDQEGLDDDLQHLVTWSADNGLLINKRLNVRNASFIPPSSRSPSLTVKHHLERKRPSILMYILTPT